jgi:hypothetical protein
MKSNISSRNVAINGTIYLLDENLELLSFSESPNATYWNTVCLVSGGIIACYYDREMNRQMVMLFDNSLVFIRSWENEFHHFGNIYTDHNGGYYATTMIKSDIVMSMWSSFMPLDIIISRFDAEHNLIWSRRIYAKDFEGYEIFHHPVRR